MLPLGHMGITFAATRVLEKLLKQQRVDYRLLLTSSLLPDIIDKTSGLLLSAGHKLGDKSWGHSLIFLALILGIILIQRQKRCNTINAETILFGSAVHDLLDTMWHFPEILFWPVGHLIFSTPPYEAWAGTIHLGVFKITELFSFEIIGGCILTYFLFRLVLNSRIIYFISTGKLTRDASTL